MVHPGHGCRTGSLVPSAEDYLPCTALVAWPVSCGRPRVPRGGRGGTRDREQRYPRTISDGVLQETAVVGDPLDRRSRLVVLPCSAVKIRPRLVASRPGQRLYSSVLVLAHRACPTGYGVDFTPGCCPSLPEQPDQEPLSGALGGSCCVIRRWSSRTALKCLSGESPCSGISSGSTGATEQTLFEVPQQVLGCQRDDGRFAPVGVHARMVGKLWCATAVLFLC